MSQQNGRTGLILAALGAFLVVALGFFFFVKPQLDAAASANAEQRSTSEDNDRLDLQLAALKKLATQVDGWQKDLDAIAVQMPSLPALDELERVLVATGTQAGVAHVESRVEAISSVDGGALAASGTGTAPATGPAATGGEDSGVGSSAAPTPTPQPEAAPSTSTTATVPAIDGLVAIQFSIVVEGTPDAVMRFINLLHTQQDRYITLSGFTILRSEGAEESPGRPALLVGDWSVTVNALAFVIIDPANPIEVDGPGGVQPFAGSILNPFRPVGS